MCVEWLGLSQIYYHKELPGEIPPGNSRRCPQVTDTQGRRGTKYVLGASVTSFCRSRKYFLFVSLQRLPASYAAVEVQFWETTYVSCGFLDPFFLSAFIIDKQPPLGVCIYLSFLYSHSLHQSNGISKSRPSILTRSPCWCFLPQGSQPEK